MKEPTPRKAIMQKGFSPAPKQMGPLFNPFETLTPTLIREKNAVNHFYSRPAEFEFHTPTKKQATAVLVDYYPSPVDLPPKSYTMDEIQNIRKINAVAEGRRNMSGFNVFGNNDNESDDFEPIGPPNNENDTPEEIPASVWVPDRAIDAINMERQMEPDISDSALAQKILKENLPLVAVGLTHTAKYSSDQRLRFQAQTYIMDRVLGKVGTVVVTEDSPIDDLNKQLMELVNASMNVTEKSE